MKKLILFSILFVLFAASSIQAQIYPTLDQRIGAVEVDTITVTTTAVQVRTQPNAAWCQFTHEHATGLVWIGGSGVTAAKGWGALAQYDTTERYPVTNTNVFYLVSDQAAGVVVRILWGKDGTPD